MKRHRDPAQESASFPASILAEVRRIAQETLAEEEVTVYLFGSWARGEATSRSDIDLAVESQTPLPRGLLARLRERLEESHIPYRVDVVDLQKTDAAFRRRVLEEGILWSD